MIGLALIGLATAGAVFLTGWGAATLTGWCIQRYRRAVWSTALFIARERPDTLAAVIPQLLQLGVILDTAELEARMPAKVRRFLDDAPEPTEVEIVVTDQVEVITEVADHDLTSAAENDMYFAAAQDAWARIRELEDQVALLEAERDYKDELRARHLRRVRRIEGALADPDADVFAAVHPFLARDSSSPVGGSPENQP